MKKTALTMTDSEKLTTEKGPSPSHLCYFTIERLSELSGSHPKTPEEENQALRIIVEQQEIAMDMIMRKYREQVDSLTKVSHLDVRKLYYKRFLDTIINQANKMDEMTTTMRKNLLIIFKYEEVMRQIESENETLRAVVRKLTLAVQEAKKKADTGKVMNEAGSQTHLQGNTVSSADKSVGTSMAECESLENAPQKQDRCTDMIPYKPFSDSFSYFGVIHNTRPSTKPLDVDAAFDLYVNRFSKETKKPIYESISLPSITSTEMDGKPPSEVGIPETFEDSSEELASSTRAVLTEVDELSSGSIISLTEDSCSNQDSKETVFDDIL